jgi:hypothetical protein
MGNGCIIYQTLMVDPYYLPHVNTLQEEEIGLFNSFEMDINMVTTDFTHIWYASNFTNCNYGMWYDIIVAADAFDLKATLQNQNQVNVNWQTTNEHHVARFDIERKTPSTDFKTITSVPSQGDNPNQNEYSYTDQLASDLLGENIQYRIKMIDLDGKVQYSNTVFLSTNEKGSVEVSPIPFYNQIKIDHLLPNEIYDLTILDFMGHIIKSKSLKTQLDGTVIWKDFDELSDGLFILKLTNQDGFMHIQKIIKSTY